MRCITLTTVWARHCYDAPFIQIWRVKYWEVICTGWHSSHAGISTFEPSSSYYENVPFFLHHFVLKLTGRERDLSDARRCSPSLSVLQELAGNGMEWCAFVLGRVMNSYVRAVWEGWGCVCSGACPRVGWVSLSAWSVRGAESLSVGGCVVCGICICAM